MRIIFLKFAFQRDGSQVLKKMGVENLHLKGREEVSKFSPRGIGVFPFIRYLVSLLFNFFLLSAGQFC